MTVWTLRSRGIDLTSEGGDAARKRGCFSDAKTGRGLVAVGLRYGRSRQAKEDIDTEFGPLKVFHNLDQVREEERKNIKEGGVLYATGVISADPAIDGYERGFIKDEANNYLYQVLNQDGTGRIGDPAYGGYDTGGTEKEYETRRGRLRRLRALRRSQTFLP